MVQRNIWCEFEEDLLKTQCGRVLTRKKEVGPQVVINVTNGWQKYTGVKVMVQGIFDVNLEKIS